jgi:hypothetical protein
MRAQGWWWAGMGMGMLACLGCGAEGDPELGMASRVPAGVTPAAVAPAMAEPAAVSPAPAADLTLRTREITVDRLIAGIVYADRVEAESGRVDQVFQSPMERQWETEVRDGKLETAQAEAPTVYAQTIKVGFLQAREVHAREVRIKPPGK